MNMKHIPIHRPAVKRYSSPRGSYDEPLLVRLRSKYHNTHAVGFRERIVASGIEEDDYQEPWPIGFTGGLTRTKS